MIELRIGFLGHLLILLILLLHLLLQKLLILFILKLLISIQLVLLLLINLVLGVRGEDSLNGGVNGILFLTLHSLEGHGHLVVFFSFTPFGLESEMRVLLLK